MSRIATVEDWRCAVECARAVLSYGANGAFVRRGESWVHALDREAGAIITAEGKARAKGQLELWVDVVTALSHAPSLAPDRMVQCWDGYRLPISALPQQPPPPAPKGPPKRWKLLQVVKVPVPHRPCGRPGCARRIESSTTAWCWSDQSGTWYHPACAGVHGPLPPLEEQRR